MARFEKGNKLARGGRREGAGRKPVDREEVLKEVEALKLLVDHGDGDGPKHTELLMASFVITGQIAAGEFTPIKGVNQEGEEVVLDDGSGRARVQLAACKMIQDRFLGRPAVSVTVNHNGGGVLLQKLESYIRPVLDVTAREISAPTDDKPAAKTRRLRKG